MRLALASLVLLAFACDRPAPDAAPKGSQEAGALTTASPAASSTTAPGATPSATAATAPAPARPELLAFQGTIGGRTSFRMALERTGDKLEGLVARSGEDVPLRGAMKDRTRFSVTEVVPRGKPSAAFEGVLDGQRVTGSWTDGTKSLPVTGGPIDAFGTEKKHAQSYLGSLGSKIRIRMQLSRDGARVSGVYRYTRSKEDLKLEGSVSETDGKLDLRETTPSGKETGRFQGVFLSRGLAFGRWSTPDGSRSMPFTIRASNEYPAPVTLSGALRIVPQEDYKEQTKFCTRSVLFPAITGAPDKAAEAALNRALKATAQPGEMECAEATDELRFETDATYTVTARRPTRAAIAYAFYVYAGGAHGMHTLACHAIDVEKGTMTKLVGKLLTEEARKKLGALATAGLKKEHAVTKLTDAGFAEDDVKVGDDTTLCIDDKSLVVQYQPYEVAPYAMGAPRVTIAPADAKPLVLGTALAPLLD